VNSKPGQRALTFWDRWCGQARIGDRRRFILSASKGRVWLSNGFKRSLEQELARSLVRFECRVMNIEIPATLSITG
jgi:hypothetical protein